MYELFPANKITFSSQGRQRSTQLVWRSHVIQITMPLKNRVL